MKKKIIVLTALIAGLYSCQSLSGRDGFLYTINLDRAETIDSPLASELCDEVQTIILETSENSFMSDMIMTLSRVNDRLYVFDRSPQTGGSVLEFDTNGRFIKRFGRRGREPGEYNNLSGFAVDQANGLIYLSDNMAGQILSYDLDSGQYIETLSLDRNEGIVMTIAPVGDLIYSDLNSMAFDESNSMLKSWSRNDPTIENYYLPIGKHLEGWNNVSVVGNSQFIYRSGNEYALFSNKYSPEVFKVTPEGVENYIYIESKDFVNKKDREAISAQRNADTGPGSSSSGFIDRFTGMRDYFETEKFISFMLLRGNSLKMFRYDKKNKTTQATNSLYNDLIVKQEYPEAQGVAVPFYTDREGIYYYTRTRMIPRLRTAAQEGMLVDNLDRLDELKQLPDDANPVIFYLKFKEPMR
ncbi:MAG: 6-bladed beta-propeller [Rikenellaceae bacterium]|jgi:hypothetical protein|nr:6-bladed beta-propeller [Rikenellaceae bacterium]